jgi:ADP-ribose pyrophosphatase YjhB (NUDIX family)
MDRQNELTSLTFDTDRFIPGQSVDCVIIGFDHEGLKVLVMKWKGAEMYCLPGGFIRKEEDLDKAAIRVLEERTGIQLPFLEQYKTFGNANRRDGDTLEHHLRMLQGSETMAKWLQKRFISTGYVSLIDMSQCEPQPDLMSESIGWFGLGELPDLIFDHSHMVQEAVEYIRNQVNYLPIGISLLPEKFTMKELQHLYESILEKKLDRGNFQRKMLKLGIFVRHEKQRDGGAHKAPYLYSFDRKKFHALLAKGIGFVS